MNNSNDDLNGNKKLLKQKRKPPLSLEEIINIYCKQHNIEDNEISEKIKTIYYHNPEQNILINYNKDNGDEFPLSRHLKSKPKREEINFEEEEDIYEEIKEKEKSNVKENKNDEKEEKINENINEEILLECFICGWKFLKEMSIEEKNRHINMCLEGKGEENKKELISTYKELDNLRNNENRENNQNNDDEGGNNEENLD
jgi:hypothetical protein